MPDLTKPDFLVGIIHVLYYIYYFKYNPNPCDLLGKLREYGLEGMGWLDSNLLHEPSPQVLLSELGTQVALQAHEGGFVPKISTSKSFYTLVYCGPSFLLYSFCLKHIANPKWLALSPIATKCNLQGTTMSGKH